MQYGTLYIFNYQAKNGTFYFIAKVNNKHYFVRLYNELMEQLYPHISKANQLYLRYTGYFVIDEDNNSLSIIKNDTPSRF